MARNYEAAGKLRAHQAKAIEIAKRYERGQLAFHLQKFVLASVTPGGGKTLMALLYADVLLAAGLIKQVLIIVPNDALRSQMIDGFRRNHAGITRGLRRFTIRGWRQQDQHDRSGFVTTYQAAVKDDMRRALVRCVQSAPTLVILDEPHHLANRGEDGESVQWFHGIVPIVAAAVHVLLMSGTLRRHDKAKIAFVKYGDDKCPQPDIVYSRSDGLRDGAILPVEYQRIDAESFFQKGARTYNVILSEVNEEVRAAALRTVLESSEYREHVLRTAVEAFLGYCANVAAGRMIAICHTQPAAEACADFIRETLGQDVALAISKLPNAADVIRDFRRGVGPKILVTVGMAYEGLDVPSATHLVLLTDKRSIPYLEQSVARVTRVNPDPSFPEPHDQRAFVFGPDDIGIRDFIDALNAEQQEAFEDKEKGSERDGYVPRRSALTALDVTPTDTRYSDSAGNLSNEQSALVQKVREEHPELKSLAPREILSFFARIQGKGGSNDSGSGAAE